MAENLTLGLFLALPSLLGGLLVAFFRSRRARSFRTGWFGLLTGNALLLLLLFSLTLLAGEVFIRFFYDTTDSLAHTKVSQRWLQRHWQVNPAGVRDNIQYGVKIKPDHRRITFVGDSFTAGHGVPDVEDRFVNRLRRRHPEWEVHALAELGMDTGDEIKFLGECLGKGYEIDQVVLVYCLNDVSDLMPAWKEMQEKFLASLDRTGWLKNSSYFLNWFYYRFQTMQNPQMKNYFQVVRETSQGPVWEEQKGRLRAFQELVEFGGGHLSVVTFPFLHAVGPDYEFQAVHDALGRHWREMKVPHLDLLPVYRNLPARKITVNSFDAHPNEYAHALAADAIEKFLQEHLPASR